MPLANAWYTRANAPFPLTDTGPNACKSFLWLWKQLLKGGPNVTFDVGATGAVPAAGLYTVVGSSDGASAAMDGVDRLGDTFDAAKVVWSNSDATPHSWIVLHNAAGGFYVTLEANNRTGVLSESECTWHVSKTAPTLAATSTHAPVQTNALGYSTVAVDYCTMWDKASANTPARMHMSVTAQGHFCLVASKNGTGRAQGYQMLMPVSIYQSGDTNPFFIGGGYDGTNGIFAATAGTGRWRQGMNSGTRHENGMRTFSPGGVAGGATPLNYIGYASNTTVHNVFGTAPLGSPPAYSGKDVTLPVFICSTNFAATTAGAADLKGVCEDLNYGPGATQHGRMTPPLGGYRQSLFGVMYLPMSYPPLL